MSKYVIDLRPDCKIVQQICVSDGQVGIGAKSIEYLEELNADYVNEHFGSLQDDAYKRGLEDGKKEAESSEAIEQARADAFNKGMLFKEEKIHDAFLRGVEKGKAVNDKGCEGCKYGGSLQGSSPCYNCSNYYKNNWTAKADKIGVGDVVKTYNGITFVVTKTTIAGIVVGFDGEGNTCRFALSEVTKTGEHYNINEILGGLSDD